VGDVVGADDLVCDGAVALVAEFLEEALDEEGKRSPSRLSAKPAGDGGEAIRFH
jgi:hypothetical protein